MFIAIITVVLFLPLTIVGSLLVACIDGFGESLSF